MFGDMGHGAIMLCAALFFILKEKQLEAARIKDEVGSSKERIAFDGEFLKIPTTLRSL